MAASEGLREGGGNRLLLIRTYRTYRARTRQDAQVRPPVTLHFVHAPETMVCWARHMHPRPTPLPGMPDHGIPDLRTRVSQDQRARLQLPSSKVKSSPRSIDTARQPKLER